MTARLMMILLPLLAACGQPAEPGDTTTSTTSADVTTVPSEPTTTAPPARPESPDSALSDAVLDAMVADAAEQTGVDPGSVEVISITEETFDDASLGCPEPGQAYAQVITPGHIVTVEAGDEELEYRVGTGTETWKLCD